MRIPSNPLLLLAPALLPTVVSATGFDCKHITADGYKYDLSALGGVHTLYHVDETEDYGVNTTYVLNICNILKGASMRDGMKCGTSKNSMPGASLPCVFLLTAASLRLPNHPLDRRRLPNQLRVPDRGPRPCRLRDEGPGDHAAEEAGLERGGAPGQACGRRVQGQREGQGEACARGD